MEFFKAKGMRSSLKDSKQTATNSAESLSKEVAANIIKKPTAPKIGNPLPNLKTAQSQLLSPLNMNLMTSLSDLNEESKQLGDENAPLTKE